VVKLVTRWISILAASDGSGSNFFGQGQVGSNFCGSGRAGSAIYGLGLNLENFP